MFNVMGTRSGVVAAVLVALCLGSVAWAEPDWAAMSYTAHEAYQVVDGDGVGTFPVISPIKMRGVILNRSVDMLDGAAGADPFMGGQWQVFFGAVDAGDFGGTAMYMGQNIGKIVGNHPAGSYTDSEWFAELDRLNHDPVTGRLFQPGDLVEIRARAPGLFFRGKTNINEQHQKTTEADFDVVLLQANYGLPTPTVVQLSSVKDASDLFIFDATRASGAEHYQGDVLKIENVEFTAGTWGPGQTMTISDGSGRTLPVLLGLGGGFSLYDAPSGSFDIVGVFDQEDTDGTDGYKASYRLWVMDYDGSAFVLCRYVKPDFDEDGDVDNDDFAHFGVCVSGPTVPQTDGACLDADFDGDSDVDQSDFGIFQRCFSGANRLADLTCDQ